MSALIDTLITAEDYRRIVRDQIAAILVVERDSQKVLATKGVASYTRAGSSDYLVTSTAVLTQVGVYTITAGTLVAGVGEWTAEAPDASTDTFTSAAAGDDLVFSALGMTLEVSTRDTAWQTGDVITVTTYEPSLWDWKVYTGRTMPFQHWLLAPDNDDVDATPIVHVGVERQTFDKGKSNTFSRQQGPVRYAIDCYGYGKSEATDAGHTPGDDLAADVSNRVVTQARNILMFPGYHVLALPGHVGSRFPDSIDPYKPSVADRPVQNVMANRLTLEVELNEYSPQVTGEPCEGITTTVSRQSDGEVVLTTQQAFV